MIDHQQQNGRFTVLLYKHLRRNYLAKFNNTLQEASLHDCSQSYIKALKFINNNNKMSDFVIFNKTSQEASLCDPYKIQRSRLINNNKMADFLLCLKPSLKLKGKFNEMLQEGSLQDPYKNTT